LRESLCALKKINGISVQVRRFTFIKTKLNKKPYCIKTKPTLKTN